MKYYTRYYYIQPYINPQPGKLKDELKDPIGKFETLEEARKELEHIKKNADPQDWTCYRIENTYVEVSFEDILKFGPLAQR